MSDTMKLSLFFLSALLKSLNSGDINRCELGRLEYFEIPRTLHYNDLMEIQIFIHSQTSFQFARLMIYYSSNHLIMRIQKIKAYK